MTGVSDFLYYVAWEGRDLRGTDLTTYTEAGSPGLGYYAQTSMSDIVDNIMATYVGDGNLFTKLKRARVVSHARSVIKQLNYHVLALTNSAELSLNNLLTVPFPNDYVRFVKLHYINELGLPEPIIEDYQAVFATGYAQDTSKNFVYDQDGNVNILPNSVESERYRENQISRARDFLANSNTNNFGTGYYGYTYGNEDYRRYGLDPEQATRARRFIADTNKGLFTFDGTLLVSAINLPLQQLGLDLQKQPL